MAAAKPKIGVRFFTFVYNRFGVYGLLAVPVFTLTTEKCIYDTIQAYRYVDSILATTLK
jgi:hypothetical protein